ncbi:MAG: 50S ribosomal protein L25 [Eubacteriales bacterium]
MVFTNVMAVENRSLTGKSEMKKLRRAGFLPATICSKEVQSVMVSVRKDILTKIISKGGRTTVLKLTTNDGKSYDAMLKDIQTAPVTGEYLHVVFQQVSLTARTKAEVPVKFAGKESVEARHLNFLQQLDSIPVSGLPGDIPGHIEVDVTSMQAGDKLHVRDLKVSGSVTIELEPDLIIATVSEPRTHDAEDAAQEAAKA